MDKAGQASTAATTAHRPQPAVAAPPCRRWGQVSTTGARRFRRGGASPTAAEQWPTEPGAGRVSRRWRLASPAAAVCGGTGSAAAPVTRHVTARHVRYVTRGSRLTGQLSCQVTETVTETETGRQYEGRQSLATPTGQLIPTAHRGRRTSTVGNRRREQRRRCRKRALRQPRLRTPKQHQTRDNEE